MTIETKSRYSDGCLDLIGRLGGKSPYLAGDEAVEDEWESTDESFRNGAWTSFGDDGIAGGHPLSHVGHKPAHLDLQAAWERPADTMRHAASSHSYQLKVLT